jgi:hypothetical protein
MQCAKQGRMGSMKYLLLFFVIISIVLWVERYYWKRRAFLLELRLLGRDRSETVASLFDAWLDGRIDSSLHKQGWKG